MVVIEHAVPAASSPRGATIGTNKRYSSNEPTRQPVAGWAPSVEWHPVLAAVELEPGHWQMVAQYGRIYGDIRLVRRGDSVGYKATRPAGEIVGYFRTLRSSAKAVHNSFLRSHGQMGGVNGSQSSTD